MEKYHFFSVVTRLFRGARRPVQMDVAIDERLEEQVHHDEVFQALTFRQALPGDIPELARLHVTTWNDNDTSLCYVVETYLEDEPGELIGFVQGNRYEGDLAGFEGQLNKIYVLPPYQRQGIGTKLVGYLARGFLSHSIFSMVLFAEPDNPTSRFCEVLEGEKLYADNGGFHGAYGWRDLEHLAAECPID